MCYMHTLRYYEDSIHNKIIFVRVFSSFMPIADSQIMPSLVGKNIFHVYNICPEEVLK